MSWLSDGFPPAYGWSCGPSSAGSSQQAWTGSTMILIRLFVASLIALLWLSPFTAAHAGRPSLSAQQSSFPDRYDNDIARAVKHYWGDLPVWRLWKAQLFQESHLDPNVCSQVGACGLAQFMAPTFEQITRQLGQPGGSRFDARLSIDAGAYYMARLRSTWRGRSRATLDGHDLAAASYNAGTGSILRAQQKCNDALLWSGIAPCLEQITGAAHAKETTGYVAAIHRYWQIMELQ